MSRRREPTTPATDAEVEAVVRTWLHESRVPLSDVALETALAQTRTMPGSRSRRGLARGGSLVAALVAVVGLLGGLGVAASLRGPTEPMPTSATDVPPVASQVPNDVADSPLAGVWYRVGRSDRGSGVGVLRLSAFASVQGWGGVFFGLASPSVRGDTLEIPALPGGACAGLGASYRWTSDGDRVTFEAADDACPAREAALAGTWRPVEAGTALADRFQFPFLYRSTDASPMVEVGTKAHVLADGAHVDAIRGFGIWVVEDAYGDPCAATGSVTPAPGAAGLIDHLRSVAALRVDEPQSVTLDGQPATAVHIERLPGECPSGHLRLWRDSGVALDDANVWFSMPAGGRADVVLLEMDGSTVALVAWAPDGEEPTTPAIRDLLASIDFLGAGAD